MTLVRAIFFLASILLVAGTSMAAKPTIDSASIDDLIKQAGTEIVTAPEKASDTLSRLAGLKENFTEAQKNRFFLLRAATLGFKGMHKERVELVQSVIEQIHEPLYKVRFLSQLSSGFTNLGEYEKALEAMNQSMLILPKLTNIEAKVDTLQAAINVLNSLHAYDEALVYADRMLALATASESSATHCLALGDQVEINFLRGERQRARAVLPDAIRVCDAANKNSYSLLLNTLACIDLIDSGNYLQGKGAAITLLQDFSKLNQSSDYGTQLQEALARAYLHTGNLEQAERYGLQAYQKAKAGNAIQLMEKTAETMASIKRAQGQYLNSLEYFETALVLKNRVLDDLLHKNLAFQRVKFDTQDKANQLNLLEQKNKILAVERELEKKNNQNLVLLIALVLVIVFVLGIWLMRALQQKNQFRQFSQTDGLTQAANRMHFISFANEAFKMRTGSVSVILFDMDLFKNINDTHGHGTGDWVLKAVSETVKTHLRKVDLFGRLGGEEFGICMPDSSQASALQLAERCRMAIAMIDTEPSGHIFSLSASFGVATVDGNGLSNFDETLEAADKALYRSKAEGRNCVNVFRQAS
ncbi:GGDEF domain-containing protein [Undibacterium sp.]|uniref:tetratricopeptide repeat-containing diguanylate cyclase n=1 Tax=Undibacterium sp. TaxID=1914977 RepID=UPI002731D4AF|nr:GGDEF domain-containing protein [Undibacterium sp.]MDP1976701.1 diguanylate cyclase [Undibacterium sp.]